MSGIHQHFFSSEIRISFWFLNFGLKDDASPAFVYCVFETDAMREAAQAGKSRDLRFGTKRLSVTCIKPAECRLYLIAESRVSMTMTRFVVTYKHVKRIRQHGQVLICVRDSLMIGR